MAIRLNGSSEGVLFGDTDFDYRSITLCGFFKIASHISYRTIFGMGGAILSEGTNILSRSDGYGITGICVPTSSFAIASSITSTSYVFIGLTYNNGDISKLYVGDYVFSSAAINENLITQVKKLGFGLVENSSYPQYTNYADVEGYDLRVYSRAITALEVDDIKSQNGYDTVTTDLVGRWLMDEKSAGELCTEDNSILDISGRNIHGSPVGTPVYVDNPVGYYTDTPTPEVPRRRFFRSINN